MGLTSSMRFLLQGQLDAPVEQLGRGASVNRSLVYSFADGVGANQANRMWFDERTLAPSATEDIDLAGVLLDAFGAGLTFARIKGLLLEADTANVNDVQVSRPAANGVLLFLAALDAVVLRPGAVLGWCDPSATGLAVGAGASDLMTFTNGAGGTSVKYRISILGGAS